MWFNSPRAGEDGLDLDLSRLICLSRIDQAGKRCLNCLSGIYQPDRDASFERAGFLVLLRKSGKLANIFESLC